MATQEEKELQAIVAQQQEQIDELKATVNQWRLNGADDMFGGAGFQRYGGGTMRIDGHGQQILAPGGETPGIFFMDEFMSDPTADPEVLSHTINDIRAYSDPDDNHSRIILRSTLDSSDRLALCEVASKSNGGFTRVHLSARDALAGAGGSTTTLSVRPEYVSIDSVLRLIGVTSDPTGPNDGSIWYRSDIDKLRARIDGVTVNLAREGKLIVGGGSTLTISSGAITVTNGYHHVDTEGSASNDDLDTINGGEEGQILVISTVADGRKVSVTENGNIALSSATMNLDSTEDVLMLMYSGPQSLWLEVSRSTNG